MRLLSVVALAACLAVACAAVNTRTLLRRAASRYSWEPDPAATQVANPPPYWKPGPEWQKADSGVYYKFPEPGKGDWKKGFCVSKPDVTQAEMGSLSERQWLTDLMWFLGQGCNAGNKYHVRNWEGKGMLNDCASTVGLVFFDCCFQGKWTVVPRQGNEVYASNCEKLYRVRQWWDAVAGEDGAAFCVCSQTRDYIRRRMANFASKLDDPRNLQPPPSISGDEPPASFSASYPTPSSLQAPKKKKNRSSNSYNNGLSSASDSDPTPSWANNKNGKSGNAASWGLNANGGVANNNNNNNNNNANKNGNGNTQTATVANKTPGSPTAAPAPAPANATATTNSNNNNQQKQGSPTQAPTNGVKQGAPQAPTAAVNGVKQGSPQTSASQTANKTAGAAPGQNPVKAQVLSGNNSTSSNNNNNNGNNNSNAPSSNGSGSSSSSPSSNGASISGSGGSNKQDSPFLSMSKDDSMTIITNDNSMIHKESHMAGH